MPLLWRDFVINGCWILSGYFSASIEVIISFLFVNLVMWCSTLSDLWILKNPCIPGINPCWSEWIILLMYCWIQFASILLKIFLFISSVILFYSISFCLTFCVYRVHLLPAVEKEMATHSSILAWRIPETEEPGGLPSMGSHRVGHDWSDLVAAAAICRVLVSLYFGVCL